MHRLAIALVAFAAATAAPALAQVVEKSTVRSGDVDVPIEVARPAGAGPFAPLLYIHARRGLENEDRQKMRALADMGFIVVAPDSAIRPVPRALAGRARPGDRGRRRGRIRSPGATGRRLPHSGRHRRLFARALLRAEDRGRQRPRDVAAIVSYYGHMQNPNAPEPDQVFRVAPEVQALTTPMLMLIGDQDFEVRRMQRRACLLRAGRTRRPRRMQMYPMARRAFDFRGDQTPEERIATRHARERARDWLYRSMKLGPKGECPSR